MSTPPLPRERAHFPPMDGEARPQPRGWALPMHGVRDMGVFNRTNAQADITADGDSSPIGSANAWTRSGGPACRETSPEEGLWISLRGRIRGSS